MKRCPQCEFIYEDDQNCCDMDGISLVLTQTTPAPLPNTPKRNGPRRSLLSVCGVVLGVVVLAIGYASLERAVTVSSESAFVSDAAASQQVPQDQSTSHPAEDVVSPAVEPEVGASAENPSVSMVSETAKASRVAASDPNARELALKSVGTEPLRRNRLGTRGVVLGNIPEQTRIDSSSPQSGSVKSTSREPERKDSKVVSIVKKTGRLLKKPFKL